MIAKDRFSLLKYSVYLLTVIFFLWLLNLNFPLSRQQMIILDFFNDQRQASRLGPGDRLRNDQGLAAIIDHPVYFDLRFLPWYSRAKMTVVFKENGRKLEGLGRQTGPGFSFSVEPPLSVNERSEGENEAVFIIDLDKVYTQRNITRFLIASKPEKSDTAGELTIRSFTITLIR